jgi:hypothetical protein
MAVKPRKKEPTLAELLAQYGRNIASDVPVVGRRIVEGVRSLPEMADTGSRFALGAAQRLGDMLPPELRGPALRGDYRTTFDAGADIAQLLGRTGNQLVTGTSQRGLDAMGAPRGAGYDPGATRMSRGAQDAIVSGVQALPGQLYDNPLSSAYEAAMMVAPVPGKMAVRALEGAGALAGRAVRGRRAAPVAKRAAETSAPKAAYVDPETRSIEDWNWRPLGEVQQDLGDLSAVSPEAINFGRFMQEKNLQAQRGMEPRDLLKAYGITRSSIQRQARPLATAERGGLELGQLNLDMVRPEGAFAEWLGTDAGQAYLDAAQRGQVRTDALEDLQAKFSPFGFQNKLAEDLEWAAQNLPQEAPRMSDLILATPGDAGGIADYRAFIRDKVRGVAAPKAGFVGSMLGRGDLPTLDARQIVLNTGRPTADATSYMGRKSGLGGLEAVDRLAGRLSSLGLALPDDLAPYYQHLAHHTVWDKAGNEATTHADLMNAMRNYATGGAVSGRSH